MPQTTSETTTSPHGSATAPAPQVWPMLRARDARALIRFLTEAFGFEATAVYGDGERVVHAELSWPEGGGIMLGSVREADDDPCGLQSGAAGAYVVTGRPDALCARARAAGAEITDEPADTDYGSRGFSARDPEGNRWSFGTYRGAPQPVRS
ncbi:VOC family protein [Streptomyces sp. NPDC001633]|uniref:VOC family protein n=1 Tax=Streptomyces sp. NPDC001633 TaxID=3364595 RepID=UPI0036B7542B